MKKSLMIIFGVFFMQAAGAHGGHSGRVDDSVPDVQKIRFCERVRDHALQTFYNRDKGRPMKLFDEDGSDGARITNHIIRRIYEEPQISSPKKAETFGRATCNELMGSKLAPE
ncbi:MAG: hypothetical protein U0989_18305 [Azonexus sp.]|nr:hypothetical protein [Azonexus sp.]MDZ4316708.1 hypothetical protein [Azonexus sp.]